MCRLLASHSAELHAYHCDGETRNTQIHNMRRVTHTLSLPLYRDGYMLFFGGIYCVNHAMHVWLRLYLIVQCVHTPLRCLRERPWPTPNTRSVELPKTRQTTTTKNDDDEMEKKERKTDFGERARSFSFSVVRFVESESKCVVAIFSPSSEWTLRCSLCMHIFDIYSRSARQAASQSGRQAIQCCLFIF